MTRVDELEKTVEEGLAFCDVRDLTPRVQPARHAGRGIALLRGRHDEAEAMLDALHADVGDPGVLECRSARVSGVLLTRRGLPGAERWLAPLLAEALREAGHPPDRWPPATADLPGWSSGAGWRDRAEECRPLAAALLARAAMQPLDLDSASWPAGCCAPGC